MSYIIRIAHFDITNVNPDFITIVVSDSAHKIFGFVTFKKNDAEMIIHFISSGRPIVDDALVTAAESYARKNTHHRELKFLVSPLLNLLFVGRGYNSIGQDYDMRIWYTLKLIRKDSDNIPINFPLLIREKMRWAMATDDPEPLGDENVVWYKIKVLQAKHGHFEEQYIQLVKSWKKLCKNKFESDDIDIFMRADLNNPSKAEAVLVATDDYNVIFGFVILKIQENSKGSVDLNVLERELICANGVGAGKLLSQAVDDYAGGNTNATKVILTAVPGTHLFHLRCGYKWARREFYLGRGRSFGRENPPPEYKNSLFNIDRYASMGLLEKTVKRRPHIYYENLNPSLTRVAEAKEMPVTEPPCRTCPTANPQYKKHVYTKFVY